MGEYLCFVAAGFYRIFAMSPKVTARNVAELLRKKKKATNNKDNKHNKNKKKIDNKIEKANKCIGWMPFWLGHSTRSRLYHHGQPCDIGVCNIGTG